VPNFQPFQAPGKIIESQVQIEPETFPFVVLVKSPQVHHTRCPEALSFEPAMGALLDGFRFRDLE
jgi:hypothetical protein